MTATVLGVDIGGTKVALGRVNRDGRILGEVHSYNHGVRHEDELLAVLRARIGRMLGRSKNGDAQPVKAIGVACAGTVNQGAGVVVQSPNLPLVDTKLRAFVENEFGLPTTLENDVNAALWAERKLGAARGVKHALMLTLGTGLGGALLLDGRLYRGAQGAAGEVGHIIVDQYGESCRCGLRGCLEAYVAAPAFERIGFRTVGLFERGAFTGELIGRLAVEGSAAAKQALDEIGSWLGVGISNLTNILNPEVVIVGGGLSQLGDLLLEPARKTVREYALRPGRDLVRIVQAELGPAAGMVGAALLVWDAGASGLV